MTGNTQSNRPGSFSPDIMFATTANAFRVGRNWLFCSNFSESFVSIADEACTNPNGVPEGLSSNGRRLSSDREGSFPRNLGRGIPKNEFLAAGINFFGLFDSWNAPNIHELDNVRTALGNCASIHTTSILAK